MGIRALCAAAAVVVGVGSAAEAATVDVVATMVYAEYSTGPVDDHSSWVITNPSEYWGIPNGQSLPGTLSMSDVVYDGFTHAWATFVVSGATIFDHAVSGDFSSFYGMNTDKPFQFYSLEWNGKDGLFQYSSDMGNYLESVVIEFTLAPVPLPATAALLPVGLGALAMMRRRRRLFN